MEENKEKKNSNIKFIVFYVIFIIVLITSTIFAFLFTLNFFNKDISNITFEEDKKEAKDKEYVVSSYYDTYNENSITITNYYDIDGNILEEDLRNDIEYKQCINYIQISGLKDEKIESKINKELKKRVYGLNIKNANTNVTANFSNILSVTFYGYDSTDGDTDDKSDYYTVNLATGEEIELEELFVSSATIKSYIVEGLYEELAWSNQETGNYDMSKVDTSGYEDKFLMIAKNYDKNKDSLKYSLYANSIFVYGLLDKRIVNKDNLEEFGIQIDLTNHIYEVAMYKKFLTKDSIYIDDSIGAKDTIVFTPVEGYYKRVSYGFLQNNIFIEEVITNASSEEYKDEKVMEKINKMSEEYKSSLINNNNTNTGIFAQRTYAVSVDTEGHYFNITAATFNSTCSLSYFKSNAFLDYIKMYKIPSIGAGAHVFTPSYSDNFPNLRILDVELKDYYYSTQTGEFLGDNYDEVIKKLNELYPPISEHDIEHMDENGISVILDEAGNPITNTVNSNIIINN